MIFQIRMGLPRCNLIMSRGRSVVAKVFGQEVLESLRMLFISFGTESHIWGPEENEICQKPIAILKEIQ